MTRERDAYAVLHVAPDAPQAVVQAAYRALARRYHPDGSEPQAELMKDLNLAYERVRNAERRAAYDAERRQRLVAVGPGHSWQTMRGSPSVPQPTTTMATAPARPPFGFQQASAPAAADVDVLDFGTYAGWRIAQIARHDPDYLRWLSRHSSGVRFLDAIRRCLPGEKDLGRQSSAALDW